MKLGRQQVQSIQADVDDRLRRLAAGWSPTPVVPVDLQAPLNSPEPLRHDLWSRTSWRAFVVLLAGVALIAGWLWWQAQPREITALPGASDMTSSPAGEVSAGGGEVVVHVAGAVRKPGLIHLAAGARVADAIDKAGGATSPRYLDTVNLARVLVDGEQILLGKAASASGSAKGTDGKISLSAATADDLEGLPGVGPVLAQRIIAWRTEHGAFRSVDDLDSVSGVGSALMDQLRNLVTP